MQYNTSYYLCQYALSQAGFEFRHLTGVIKSGLNSVLVETTSTWTAVARQRFGFTVEKMTSVDGSVIRSVELKRCRATAVQGGSRPYL